VSSVDPSDPQSSISRQVLYALQARSFKVALPSIARLEVACALGRRWRSADSARRITERLFRAPAVREYPMDAALMESSIAVGLRSYLRGSDAVYAALAHELRSELIAWDNELIERAQAVSPDQWLEMNDT
jgi:predicted nucleic acid-binding protein